MGRKPKTLAELKASGAMEKNPQRYRDREDAELQPEPGVGPPPATFLVKESATSRLQLEAWNELIAGVPEGVLTKMDRHYIISLARMSAEATRNPFDTRIQKRFIDALKEAPFTPKARAGFAIRRQKAADEANNNRFSEFATRVLPPRVQ